MGRLLLRRADLLIADSGSLPQNKVRDKAAEQLADALAEKLYILRNFGDNVGAAVQRVNMSDLTSTLHWDARNGPSVWWWIFVLNGKLLLVASVVKIQTACSALEKRQTFLSIEP